MPRIQRRFLLHSRWTACVPADPEHDERHFEVVAISRAQVTLRAVLTGREVHIEIAALEDSRAWSSGWRTVIDLES